MAFHSNIETLRLLPIGGMASSLASLWNDLLTFLNDLNHADPTTYLVSLFLFSFAAAVVLPIPVETAVALAPEAIPIPVVAVASGLGKGLGAMAVFFLGGAIEKTILTYTKWRWFRWLLNKSEIFVRRFGYPAIYVIMSIPLMVDTVPLYLFSLLNKEGKLLNIWYFTLVNVAAGFTRAVIVLLLRDSFI